jgi:hypothetical protein
VGGQCRGSTPCQRHSLGACDRAHNSWSLRLLPRQCCCTRRGRRHCCRRSGGALHTQEARPELSVARRSVLPEPRRQDGSGHRLRRVLREAAAQVRAPGGNLSRVCAERLQELQHGAAGVAEGEGQSSPHHQAVTGPGAQGAARIHGSPREPCGERVLPQPVRRGRDSYAGRRGRMEHHHVRGGARQSHSN